LAGDANEAAARVTWKFVRRDGGHYVLEASNPTPYHVNFTTLTARSGASKWTNDRAGTVEPHGTARFDLGNISPASDTPDEVAYTFINDFGAGVSATASGRTK
jgi:chaperone protein EcpD